MSTAAVINELEAEAERFTQVALAVGFESTTLFIWSSEDGKIKKLNQMIEEGGEPIGLLAFSLEGAGRLTMMARPLDEYADEQWARQ